MHWGIERVVHFEPGEFIKSGLSHFGFHQRDGSYFGISHPKHFLGAVDTGGSVLWTMAAVPVIPGVPNIEADLNFPMYVDTLPDGRLVVSNFGDARLFSVDVGAMEADLLVDGVAVGMTDMGNCVVDASGSIWINEVTGCRVWRFDSTGKPMQVIGNGNPGFQLQTSDFKSTQFGWIYDIRLGPNGNIYVLDSGNFALRMIDLINGCVTTLAGNGSSGYAGDGEAANKATFGGDSTVCFNGPISLAIDEEGNIFVGDRYNHVIRMIDRTTGIVSTIAGHVDVGEGDPTDALERDPLRANLPQISSLDFSKGVLFVPTDLSSETGDLVLLRRMD